MGTLRHHTCRHCFVGDGVPRNGNVMMFRSDHGFWKKRGIDSLEQNQNLQRLPDTVWRQQFIDKGAQEAGATPWAPMRDPSPSQEEDRQ